MTVVIIYLTAKGTHNFHAYMYLTLETIIKFNLNVVVHLQFFGFASVKLFCYKKEYATTCATRTVSSIAVEAIIVDFR